MFCRFLIFRDFSSPRQALGNKPKPIRVIAGHCVWFRSRHASWGLLEKELSSTSARVSPRQSSFCLHSCEKIKLLSHHSQNHNEILERLGLKLRSWKSEAKEPKADCMTGSVLKIGYCMKNCTFIREIDFHRVKYFWEYDKLCTRIHRHPRGLTHHTKRNIS